MGLTFMPSHKITLGILCSIGASISFSVNDFIVKSLSSTYPVSELVCIRSFIGLVIILGVLVPIEGGYRIITRRNISLHLLRGLLMAVTAFSFFLGIASLPLSEAVAIFFIYPVIITLFSILFLSEKVTWRLGLAVGIGFIGTLMILRPSSSFQIWMILPFLSSFSYAGCHTLTRKLGEEENAVVMSLYVQFVFFVVSVLLSIALGHGHYDRDGDPTISFLLRGWLWPQPQDMLLMILLGFISTLAIYMIGQAYRICSASIIAPFEYMALITGVALGVIFLGERPAVLTWVGIAIILVAGLSVVWNRKEQAIQ